MSIESGTKYGRMTVVGFSERRRGMFRLVVCRCECGTECEVSFRKLVSGKASHPGCKAEPRRRRRRHYDAKTRELRKTCLVEYRALSDAIYRCHNPTAAKYPYYGARGIKVCEEWRENFRAFLDEIGCRPGPGYSLDRVDNDGNYEPGNVKWSTAREQANNRRPEGRNMRLMTLYGRTQTLAQWAREIRLSRSTLKSRVSHGWSDESALLVPRGGCRVDRWYVATYGTPGNERLLTIEDLSKMSGIGLGTIYTRLRVGWKLVDAVCVPRSMTRAEYYDYAC